MQANVKHEKARAIIQPERTAANHDVNNLMIKEIKCFQHCSKSERYLCFELPEKCPSCKCDLNAKIKFKVPPFLLPKPLTLTNTQLKFLPSFSLLLQPTGCDYRILVADDALMGDLHIGVTNSNSDVFDFNHIGLNRNAANWFNTPSIVIEINYRSKFKILNPNNAANFEDDEHQRGTDHDILNENFGQKWDFLLDFYWKKRKQLWSKAMYDANNFNCLDFIINFFLEFGLFDLNEDQNDINVSYESFLNKETSLTEKQSLYMLKNFLKKKISKELIEPEFVKCLKYINLLINLNENKFILEKVIV